MKTTRGILILLGTGLLMAGVFATSAGASTTSKHPPCTQKALSAGLKRGSAPKNAKFLKPFGCARGWAYSAILVGGRNGFEATAVYKAKNGVWVTVNRAKPCRTHAIPKKIYRGACTTS